MGDWKTYGVLDARYVMLGSAVEIMPRASIAVTVV